MISKEHFILLIDCLERLQPLSVALKSEMLKVLRITERSRGEQLIRFGQKHPYIWFMVKGYAMEITHQVIAGTQRTSWFYKSKDFLFSSHTFFSGEVSLTDIEMISDATLIEIDFEDLIRLRRAYKEFDLLIELIRSRCELERYQHGIDIITLNVHQRADQFDRRFPSLSNLVLHKHINQFLNLSHHSFSRYLTRNRKK